MSPAASVRTWPERRASGAAACGAGLAVALLGACTSGQPRTEREHEARGGIRMETPVPAAMESLPPVATPRLSREQERGRTLYNSLCWTCHGLYGHGDGPAARSVPEPLPDLGRLAAQSPAGELVARMVAPASGAAGPESGAPVWHALPAESLRAAVAYLQAMNPPGARGNPAAGRLIYATFCVHCHGTGGAGDGRLASALGRRMPDLRTRTTRSEARVFANVREGGPSSHDRDMPAWGHALSDEQLWDVLSYLPLLQSGR